MAKWRVASDFTPEQWQRLKAIFDLVADTPPVEWPDRVQELCQGDEALGQAVLRVLHSHQRSTAFLDQPLTSVRPAEWRRFEAGTCLAARFHIVRFLGRGGMGEVYEASDSVLGERVALKCLPPETAGDERAVNRLRTEVRRARQVTHPNVCRVHELFETRDGAGAPLVFVTMQLLRGLTLADHLAARSSLPASEALPLLTGIAGALDACHEAGVVHGDVKPGNVFLVEAGGGAWSPVLTDFGLARPAANPTTATSLMAGTPQYMAPELLRGGVASPASDIYALGVLARDLVDAARAERWNAALNRCLSPSPPARPRTAAEFVRSLAARRISRRTMGLAAAGTLVAGGPAAWLATHDSEDRVRLAVLPFENQSAAADQYLASGITEQLIWRLQRRPGFWVAGRGSSFYYADKLAPSREVARNLDVAWLLMGAVRRGGAGIAVQATLLDSEGRSANWTRAFEAGITELQKLEMKIADAVAARLAPALAQAGIGGQTAMRADPQAYELVMKGRYHHNQRTLEEMSRAVSLFEEAIRIDSKFAFAYSCLAETLTTMADNGQLPPDETFPKAKAAALDAITLDPALAHGHAIFAAVTSIYDMDWATADRHFRRAVDLDPNDVSSRQWYSALLLKLGRVEESLRFAREAIDRDAGSAAAHFNAGAMQYYSRRYSDAAETLETMRRRWPDFHVVREMQAELYARLGRTAEAAEIAAGTLLQSRHPGHALTYAAVTLAVLGRREDAEERLRELEKASGGIRFQPFHAARAYAELGRADDAVRWLQTALDRRDSGVQIAGVHPSFDRIRDDPRYQNLMKRLRLPVQPATRVN